MLGGLALEKASVGGPGTVRPSPDPTRPAGERTSDPLLPGRQRRRHTQDFVGSNHFRLASWWDPPYTDSHVLGGHAIGRDRQQDRFRSGKLNRSSSLSQRSAKCIRGYQGQSSSTRFLAWLDEFRPPGRSPGGHFLCPAGGLLQAIATNRASPAPSSFCWAGRSGQARPRAACGPSSTQRRRTFSIMRTPTSNASAIR